MISPAETAESIRAFFLFYGCCAVALRSVRVTELQGSPWHFLALLGLILAIACVCVGVLLRTFLDRYVGMIKALLVANLAYVCVATLVELHSSQASVLSDDILAPIMAGFLTRYLLQNVDRLSAEGTTSGVR
ncbi:MAG TPA: hypothetical protein VF789_23455 [Thermoanaerobaculia bacterium]